MATFNPQVNYDRVPDTLNYSKGYTTGAGVAGKGLSQAAEVLDSKIKATDRAFAQMATDETRIAVESTDASMLGVGSTAPAVDPLEKEVRGQVRNLASKKRAMEAGSLSPEHYYATIQAKTKEIRTRYSGYNEQIDEELKRLGIDPNWQRKQILEAAEKAAGSAAAKANEADRNNRELVEYALKNVALSPEEQAALLPEGSWRDPNNMLMVKARIARQATTKASLEMTRLEAEMLDTKDKSKGKKAAEGYNRELQTQLATVVARSVDFKQLQGSLEKINKKIAVGETPSAEETSALIGRINLIKGEMNKIKLATKANYAELGQYFPEEMKKADQIFDETIDGIADSLTNQKTGLLSYHTNRLNMVLNGKQVNITQNSDQITTLSAYKNLVGDNIANTIMSRNLEQAKDAADADFRNSAAMDVALGRAKSVRAALARGDKPETFDGNSTKQLLNEMLRVTEDPNTLPEGRIGYLNGFYNDDNKALWDLMYSGNNLSEDEKQAYLKRLTGPKVIQAIKETGDINLMNSFSDTVAYLTTKANAATANDLMAIRTTSTSTDIAWDPKTSRFTLVKRADPTVNPTYRFLNKIGAKISEISGSEQQIVNRINNSITAVKDTADMLGLDKDEAVNQFLRGLGVDVTAPKQGNILERTDRSNNQYLKDKKAKDNIKGGAAEDRLGDVSFTRNTLADATANTQGELTSRNPSTRDKVMEFLQGIGVPTEQASSLAGAAELAVGPANTPQDQALAALTVVPGGRVAGMAKTAGRASLGVIEGGVTKMENLVKALPNMSPADLKKAEGEIAKEMKTVSFDDFPAMEDIMSRAQFIAAEKANREANGLKQAVSEVTNEGAKTAQRWDAIAAQVDARASGNVVSLDKVRTAREAMKVADDLDADTAKAVTSMGKQLSGLDSKYTKTVGKIDKKLGQLKNLAQDNPDLRSTLQRYLTRTEQYADAARMQQTNLERINDLGMVKGLRKIHDDLTSFQVKTLDEIAALSEELTSALGPKQVK